MPSKGSKVPDVPQLSIFFRQSSSIAGITGSEYERMYEVQRRYTYGHSKARPFEWRLNVCELEKFSGSAGPKSRLEPWESSEKEWLGF